MDNFWPSAENKAKLQRLLQCWLKDNHHHYTHAEVVLSGFYDYEGENNDCTSLKSNVQKAKPELDSHLEEADLRIIPHTMDSVVQGNKHVVILSNDTEVLVVQLFY